MKRGWMGIALLMVLALAGTTASASSVQFDLQGQGNTYSWQFDSTFSPCYSNSWYFTACTVDIEKNGVTETADIWFYVDIFHNDFTGGLGSPVDNYHLDLWGPQLFSGSTSNPTFLLGNYSLLNWTGHSYSLTISSGSSNLSSVAQVPEPSALVLLGTGAAILLIRRRFAR